ncbi:MAG TPA: GtrA family protein [Vicinamibacterales bacterium]|nr:GtrA family protein [Vicinamibacterales bacterium]
MSSFIRWITFNAVGLGGVVVQLSLVAVLTRVLQLAVAVATVAAVEAAVLHNFLWHQRWTWRDRPAAGLRAVIGRLARFHAVNGTVSLLGNVGATLLLVRAGVDPVVANLAAILACSLVNFAAGNAFVFRTVSRSASSTAVALALAGAAVTGVAAAGAQSPAAVTGWDAYIATVDRRHADSGSATFFALDLRKADRWRQRAIAGEIPMTEVDPPGVSDAKMHHWAGAVYVPRMRVDEAVKWMQDYAGRESEFYQEVKASKLLERNGDRLRVFMRLQRTAAGITANYNTEHRVEYRKIAPNRAASRSVSTKIAELANAGTPHEREKAHGEDHGFLWRLNAYWRFEQAGDGVLIECESVSLSRNVSIFFRPIVGPIANRIARESLERTLRSLRTFLNSRDDKALTRSQATTTPFGSTSGHRPGPAMPVSARRAHSRGGA